MKRKSKKAKSEKRSISPSAVSGAPEAASRKPALAAQADRPRISVCLIVKNEERYIDQCLRSVRPVADEIVIVDTGSTDRTVEICRGYTDNIHLHPWKDSFSEARNHYLDYATGDWIFQIDADEELVAEDVPKVLEAVRDPAIDGIMVQIVSKLLGGLSEGVHTVERIFRRNGVIRYEGRVHNRIVGMVNAKVCPIRLIHYGYDLNASQAGKKFDRTVTLLKRDLEEDPQNPMTHHYLGCSYLSVERYREALDASLTAIRLADARKDKSLVFLWSHYNAALSCYKLGQIDQAEQTALSALRRFPGHIDSHFILILVAFEKKQWERLIEHGHRYLDLMRLLRERPEEFGNLVTGSVSDEWNLHILIGIARIERDETAEALASFEQAASCAPEACMALRAAGIFLKEKGRLDEAAAFLERARKEKPDDPSVRAHLRQIEERRNSEATEPRISCCMIVKNEEAFLETCLRSVKDFVDEIVIVDTGSTDATVEISRRFTDKVFFHPWEGSFSKARNQALSYATGSWVFQIDGDEELIEGNGPKLRQAVRDAGRADGILVNIISTYNNGTRTARHNFERLFRNNGVIHYEGIVHNRVVGFTSVKTSKIELMHYGYDVEEKKANEKFLRTSELLKKQIEENPEDPLPHHYLGVSYLSRGMNREAAVESVRAIELASKTGEDAHPLYIWAHHTAAMAFLRCGDAERAKHYSLDALRRFPDHLDSFFTLAVIAAEEGRWEDVLSRGRSYLDRLRFYEENPDRAGYMINCTMKEGATIHLLMGHAMHWRNEPDEAERHYETARELAPEPWQAWWNAGTFYIDRSRDPERARRYLLRALAEAPEEPSVWYMLAKLGSLAGRPDEEQHYLEKLFAAGNPDLTIHHRLSSLYMKNGEDNRAREVLDEAHRLDPANDQTLCLQGYLHMTAGRLQEALEAFMKAVEIRPDRSDAWKRMGEIGLALDRTDLAAETFERVLSLEPSSAEALLRLCEAELKRNRIEAFLSRCDELLNLLGLDRHRVIHTMEDVAGVLLDIGFALRHDPGLLQLLSGLLALIPADYGALYRAHSEPGKAPGDSVKSVFVTSTIAQLGHVPRSGL